MMDVDEIVFPYFADIKDASQISNDIAAQQVLVIGIFRCGDNSCGAMTVFVYFFVIRVYDGSADVFKKRQLLRQFLGQPHIVAVKEGDVFPLGIRNALISRSTGQSGMVLTGMNGDSGISVCIRFCYLARAVSAVVVDDNQFPIGVCLRYYGFNGLSKIRF